MQPSWYQCVAEGPLHNYVTLTGGWVGRVRTLRNVTGVGGWVGLVVT